MALIVTGKLALVGGDGASPTTLLLEQVLDHGCRLPQGPPEIVDYQAALDHPVFRDMENFSDAFLRNYRAELRGYSGKRVSNPLHLRSLQ